MNSQNPNSIQVLAIPIDLFKYNLSSIIILRCCHNNLLGPGVDKLLHLVIDLINSSSEKEGQLVELLLGILSQMSASNCWF